MNCTQEFDNQLKEDCVAVAQEIETLSQNNYETFMKNKVMTIRYLLNENKEYIGAQLLVAVGGPTIWVHTMNNSIHSTWGLSSFVTYYNNKKFTQLVENKYKHS